MSIPTFVIITDSKVKHGIRNSCEEDINAVATSGRREYVWRGGRRKKINKQYVSYM